MGTKLPSRRRRKRGKLRSLMARIDLQRVARCRRKLEAVYRERDEAIRAAVASGETHRDVAAVAGLSHQRVTQIVNAPKEST